MENSNDIVKEKKNDESLVANTLKGCEITLYDAEAGECDFGDCLITVHIDPRKSQTWKNAEHSALEIVAMSDVNDNETNDAVLEVVAELVKEKIHDIASEVSERLGRKIEVSEVS